MKHTVRKSGIKSGRPVSPDAAGPDELALQDKNLLVARVLSCSILAFGVLTALFTAWLMVRAYSPAWFADQWIIPHDIAQNGGSYSLQLLWAHHNEHRMFIPKLVLLADLYLFQGRNIFPLAVIFLTQACAAAGWMYLLVRTAPEPAGNFLRTCAGLVLFCVFSPLQWENFFWAWQVTFTFPFCFAIWSIAALARYSQTRAPGFLGVSVAAFTAATLSLASGLMLLPALLAMALGLRLRWRAWVVILAAGCVNIALYLPGMQRPGGSPGLFYALSQPLLLANYVLTYFGSTWSFISPQFGRVAAVLAIVAAGLSAVALVRSRLRPLTAALTAVGVLTLATAAITAIGRVHLPVSQASSSRYQTVALLLWLATGLAILAAGHRNKRLFIGVQFLVIGTMAAASAHVSSAIERADRWNRDTRIGELALMARVEDQPVTEKLGFDGHFIYYFSGILQRMNVSVFARPEYRLLGQTLESKFQTTAASACAGALESATMIVNNTDSGYKLSGWGYATQTHTPFQTIVLVSSDGRIAGLAADLEERPDIEARQSDIGGSRVGFTGYAQRSAGGATLRAYGLMADGRSVCPLSGERQLDSKLGQVPDSWKRNAKVLWNTAGPVPVLNNARLESRGPVLTGVASGPGNDVTFTFDTKADLRNFRTLAIKARWPVFDYLDVFPGSGGGRRIYTTVQERWVYVVLDLTAGQHVDGTRVRFTPANSAHRGQRYDVAEILASTESISPLQQTIGLYLE